MSQPTQASQDAAKILFTRRCPTCDGTFSIPTDISTRPPVYCSPECKSERYPRNAIPRWCPACNTKHEVDMTGRMGSAPSFCSEACKERFTSLLRNYKPKTCALKECNILPEPGQHFCSEKHARLWTSMKYPNGRPCLECEKIMPFRKGTRRKPPKFCSQECREKFHGLQNLTAAKKALQEERLDSSRRMSRTRRRAKAKATLIPHNAPMAISHAEKRRWGRYPDHILVQILRMGWRDEEEWFTTEDRWSPALYERLSGVDDFRPLITSTKITVRKHGGEPTPLEAEDGPSGAEYLERARSLITDYRHEDTEPDYVAAYRAKTGNDPNG